MNRYTKIMMFFFLLLLLPVHTYAKVASQIDAEVDMALEQFHSEVQGSSSFVQKSVKGMLIFPKVIKVGMGIGGEYGEGVLRIDGQNVIYYSTAAASIGLQLGAQSKNIIVAFLTDEALAKFQKSDGWKVGVDGSVAVIDWGVGKDISNATFNKPVIGFIFGNKGLMYNLTIEGSKFSKIDR